MFGRALLSFFLPLRRRFFSWHPALSRLLLTIYAEGRGEVRVLFPQGAPFVDKKPVL